MNATDTIKQYKADELATSIRRAKDAIEHAQDTLRRARAAVEAVENDEPMRFDDLNLSGNNIFNAVRYCEAVAVNARQQGDIQSIITDMERS